MKLLVLGTGAGESYPGLWCTCENCSYARTYGGKNIRSNSAVMINDDLLIDMPASALQNAARWGVSLAQVKTLLVTHPHTDHFSANHLWNRNWPKAFDQHGREEIVGKQSAPCASPLPMMEIYGTRFVRYAIENAEDLTLSTEEYHYRFHEIAGGVRFETNGYQVTALDARHGEPGFTVNYILEKDGVSLLYATDTGGYSAEVWREIAAHRYHCVFLEATAGAIPLTGIAGHMNLERAEAFLGQLKAQGCLMENSQLYLTHLSPHWTPPHDKLAPMLEQKGIGVAYDGQSIEITD